MTVCLGVGCPELSPESKKNVRKLSKEQREEVPKSLSCLLFVF